MPPLPTAGSPPPAVPDVAAEVAALRDADLLRLGAIARMRARGLPGLDALDLLNEALLRLLAGTRSRPANVPLVALLATTMRSVAHDHWRRTRRESAVLVSPGPGEDDAASRQADPSPGVDPERTTAALQALAEVDRLKDGGRLVLPLTTDKGFTPPGAVMESTKPQGAVFVVTRQGCDFHAGRISATRIFPCAGLRDPGDERRLAAAFAGGDGSSVTRLHRRNAEPGEACWLAGDGWCMT